MRGHILIVDASPTNLETLTAILRGYNPYGVSSGSAALLSVQEAMPDLILLDVDMPDGYQVCQILKNDDQLRRIPILLMSEQIDPARVFQAGADDYLMKPFQMEEVLVRVDGQFRAQENQRLREINRLKDEFLQMTAHDLKNPVSIIKGYVALLLEDHHLIHPDHQSFVTAIQKGVDKVERLVSELLDLAKIEAGAVLAIQVFSLTELIAECIKEMQMPAQNKQIRLHYEPPAEAYEIEMDRQRMAQVIDNLLSNAIKYTPEGGRVEISLVAKPDELCIEVSDNGTGIASNHLPRLFEKFYRVHRLEDRDKDIDGTGLGLAIVKAIVDQHHGHIEIESEEGRGSVFTVCLPYSQP